MSGLRFGSLVVAVFVCLDIYTVNRVEATCVKNTGSPCTATQCCEEDIPPVLPAGSGGTYTPVQSCYDNGFRINYQCSVEIIGPPWNDCNAGTWSFTTGPTCEAAVTCSNPPCPTNGYCNPVKTDYDKYETVTYTCDAGYTRSGPQDATCQSDGTWYPTSGCTCEQNCLAPSIPNGYCSPNKAEYLNGEVLTYNCDANYTLVGISSCTCRNGVFDPPNVPTCYEKCNPPIVPNSDYKTQKAIIEHGSTITVTCDTQYSTGTGTETDMSCSDGSFDVADPTCYANCPVLAQFDNGVVGGDTTPYYHGETVTFTCNTGYTLVGLTSLTCNDGTWSGEQPVCKANCQLTAIPNSDLTGTPELIHNTSIIVTCNNGYSKGDGMTTEVSCNNGVQTPSTIPGCFADCVAPIIPNSDYSTQQPALKHLEEFVVTCDSGYSHGDMMSFTQNCTDGVVAGSDPTCYQDCPNFSIDNGVISGDTPPYWHEESVTITCDTNFTLVGSSMLSCSDGNWDMSYPMCASNCLPPVIPNSNYSSQFPPVEYGSSIVVGCDAGYSTGTETTQTLTCTDSGMSPSPENCYSDCTPPIVADSDYESQQDDVIHNEMFTITCNTNYSVESCSQSASVTCTNGELSRNVTCHPNCGDPGTPTDGSREYACDDFYHGITVTYRCDTRFDLNGAETIECQDGDWSDVKPNCTETALFDLIMLTCGPTSMEVEIPQVLLGDIGPTDLGMEGDILCAGYSDADLIRINTSLSGCGTNKTENATHDTYQNRVINNYYADLITRVYDVQIPMTCTYPRNQQVRALRYAIDDYVIGKNLEETGTYQMTFNIYSSGNYGPGDKYVSGRAMDVPIDHDLYFRLELVTDVADNTLVVQSCWATPTADDSDTNSHQLVTDRCPVDDTFSFNTNNPNGERIVDFELKSFRFVDDDDKEVFVHCEVFVCHEDSIDSFCDTSCTTPASRRRRRDAAGDPFSNIARFLDLDLDTDDERMKRASIHDPVVKYVKAGPIHWLFEKEKNVAQAHSHDDTGLVNEPQPPPNFETSEQSANAMMNSVISLGIVIAVFSVILMVVVRHYRRRLRKEYKYQQLSSCN